jgi:hypothetical protein
VRVPAIQLAPPSRFLALGFDYSGEPCRINTLLLLLVVNRFSFFGDSTNRIFRLQRVPDFARNDEIQWQPEFAGDFGSQRNTAARQCVDDGRGLNMRVQRLGEYLARVTAVAETHAGYSTR